MAKKQSAANGQSATAPATTRRGPKDPVRTKVLSIEAGEVDDVMACGFRQNWVDGETDKNERFTLDVGAGIGSPWMVFHFRNRWYVIHVEKFVDALMDFADEADAPQEDATESHDPAAVVLDAVVRTGECPICKHRLGNIKSRCHCTCHDPAEPFIDVNMAYRYVKEDTTR